MGEPVSQQHHDTAADGSMATDTDALNTSHSGASVGELSDPLPMSSVFNDDAPIVEAAVISKVADEADGTSPEADAGAAERTHDDDEPMSSFFQDDVVTAVAITETVVMGVGVASMEESGVVAMDVDGDVCDEAQADLTAMMTTDSAPNEEEYVEY